MENPIENVQTMSEDKPEPPKVGGHPEEKPKEAAPAENMKPKAPKAKKRKKPKDSTAPRQPLTGYIRYLNDRREGVRAANPSLSFADITKMLASEWTNLPLDKKQQYLDAAEQDRERYTKEYEAYKQTEAYKQFTQQNKQMKVKETVATTNVTNHIQLPLSQEIDFGNFDIPIFTEEFLEHNKTRDAELRQLRKINTDYEQQNALLTKHIENMQSAITKIESEILQQERTNTSLQEHLNHLKTALSNGFVKVKLPGVKEVPNRQNIETYMMKLHSVLLENDSQDTKMLQTVREVVGKLEFKG